MTEDAGCEVKAILFDLDGTLFKTANRWSERLGRSLRWLSKVFPGIHSDRLARRVMNSVELATTYGMLWLEHLGIGSSFFGLTDIIRRSKGLATRSSSSLIPGSREVLLDLSSRFKLAVVTTRQRREAETFLKAADIASYFPVVITRSDVWFIKPHPAPIRQAARKLGIPVAACLMVGDTMLDMRSARRAGARAVGVLTGYDEYDELMRAGAEHVLTSASQLANYLPRAG